MINPQKENGYTAISNEIMDFLATYRLPGEQMQCLLFVLRKTYGFNKKTDKISLSQFVKATGINRSNVARAIKGLIDKNIIHVKKGGVKKDTIKVSEYRFNKRYDTWKSSIKKDTGSIKKDTKVVSKKIHTKDTITKETIVPQTPPPEKQPHLNDEEQSGFYTTKKNRKLSGKRLDSFNRFWGCFNYKKDKANAADAWLDIPSLTNAKVDEICKAAEKEAADRPNKIAKGQTPIYAQGWITAKRWEDEYPAPINSTPRKTPEQAKAEINEALS